MHEDSAKIISLLLTHVDGNQIRILVVDFDYGFGHQTYPEKEHRGYGTIKPYKGTLDLGFMSAPRCRLM